MRQHLARVRFRKRSRCWKNCGPEPGDCRQFGAAKGAAEKAVGRKLSILFDCVWYFARGDAEDFFERRKIEFLNALGRSEFYKRLFA
jgi:hypothetical protein